MNKEGKVSLFFYVTDTIAKMLYQFPLEAISKQYSWKDLLAAELAMHDGSQIKPILVYGQ